MVELDAVELIRPIALFPFGICRCDVVAAAETGLGVDEGWGGG